MTTLVQLKHNVNDKINTTLNSFKNNIKNIIKDNIKNKMKCNTKTTSTSVGCDLIVISLVCPPFIFYLFIFNLNFLKSCWKLNFIKEVF